MIGEAKHTLYIYTWADPERKFCEGVLTFFGVFLININVFHRGTSGPPLRIVSRGGGGPHQYF